MLQDKENSSGLFFGESHLPMEDVLLAMYGQGAAFTCRRFLALRPSWSQTILGCPVRTSLSLPRLAVRKPSPIQ